MWQRAFHSLSACGISPGEHVNHLGPHPEEHRVAMRLEGWLLARPRLLPSFETRPSKSTVADFDASGCRSRASPTSVGAPQDEGLHFFTRSSAAHDTVRWESDSNVKEVLICELGTDLVVHCSFRHTSCNRLSTVRSLLPQHLRRSCWGRRLCGGQYHRS